MWGIHFAEEVRVGSPLLSELLIRRKLWCRHELFLGSSKGDEGKHLGQSRRVYGKLSCKEMSYGRGEMEVGILDADVYKNIREMDLPEFSPAHGAQERLYSILSASQAVFKGLGKMKVFRDKVESVKDARPVYSPLLRRSLAAEDTERKAMEKSLEIRTNALTVSQ